MELLERIQADVKDSMRARDTERSTQLRMFVAALQNEAKSKLRDLTLDEQIAILSRERKKRVEAAELFDKGGATEKADAEREQIVMIDVYLPQQLTEEEITAFVAEAVAETGASSPQQMGLVMKALMPKVQGRADGKLVSQAVQKALAGQ